MHIEIQVALNFVISYLYNKLPRRRVNLFGEELEKTLKDRFQGHWYPEKPFKGSAFRCLKTGDPIDAVLDRAARESGVPITDILENLPAELAVWVDPGEVSYRIGEKGAVKILYSESNDLHDDSCADREVTKTFNPEAQCFRPIDAVSNTMSQLCLSPKTSPQGSPPNATVSPIGGTIDHRPVSLNGVAAMANGGGGGKPQMATSPAPAGTSFLPRSQAPLTFTTATFAQTKFGSTKLKTSSKRTNSRMSPTEFSNYIKQRAMQQQLHHSHGHSNNGPSVNHLGPIGTASPSRSISPNPLCTLNQPSDNYYFSGHGGGGSNGLTNASNAGSLYPNFNNRNTSLFDGSHFPTSGGVGDNGYGNAGVGSIGSGLNGNKFNGGTSANTGSSFLDQHNFYGLSGISAIGNGAGSGIMSGVNSMNGPSNGGANQSGGLINSPPQGNTMGGGGAGNNSPNGGGGGGTGSSDNTKLLDGLSSFYSNSGPYQHLLVAN